MPFPGIIAGRVLNQAAPLNLAHPLNRGLVGAWLALPVAAGRSGYGSLSFRDLFGRYNGALTNGPTWGGSRGRQGGFGSLSFDGASNVVQLGRVPIEGAAAVTFSVWAYPRTAGGGTFARIFCGDGNVPFTLSMNGSATSIIFTVNSGGDCTGTVTQNAWNFITATYDGANTRLYINGTQVSSAALTGAVTFYSSAPAQALIGNRFQAAVDRGFDGLIDDVRAYTRALAADEVRALYDQSRRGYLEALNWVNGRVYMASPPAAAPVGKRLIVVSTIETY